MSGNKRTDITVTVVLAPFFFPFPVNNKRAYFYTRTERNSITITASNKMLLPRKKNPKEMRDLYGE